MRHARLLGHGLLVLAVIAGAALGETPISLPMVLQTLANKLRGAGWLTDPSDGAQILRFHAS